ncbi:hypothetical protein CRD18_10905 (plasmid) [Corynebacterium sp. LK31]|nr:hypothetical protein [Corynebacterium sp. LK31]
MVCDDTEQENTIAPKEPFAMTATRAQAPIHPSWERIIAPSLSATVRSQFGVDRQVSFSSSPLSPDAVTVRHRTINIDPRLLVERHAEAPHGAVTDTATQIRQPMMFGALFAALAPLRFSPWRTDTSLRDAEDSDAYEAAVFCDQVRAEAEYARFAPMARPLFTSWYGHDLHSFAPHYGEVLCATTMGVGLRFKAGLVDDRHVGQIPQLLEKIWGDDFAAIEKLWDDVLTAPDARGDILVECGRRWVELAQRIEDDVLLSELKEELALVGYRCKWNATEDMRALRTLFPPVAKKRGRKPAATTMQEWAQLLDPTGDVTSERSTSSAGLPINRYITYRDANQAEKNLSHRLTLALKKARYRTPRNTTNASSIPSGRLDTRQLVQAAAQRAAGVEMTATPWRKPSRKTVDQPGLSCAVVFDSSATTRMFRKNLESSTWALSHAVATIGGTVSCWGFGGESFETIRPDTTPRQVPVVTDPGSQSSHGPASVARAAAAARLLESSGARVLIVFTDGALPEGDMEIIDEQMQRLENDGVRCIAVKLGVFGREFPISHGKVINCSSPDDLDTAMLSEVINALAEQ